MRRKRASGLRLSRIYRGCKARKVRSENSHGKLDALPVRRRERSFKKIAILRFSSLGDIVLTSPLLTTFRSQFPDTEIVYVTKKSFAGILVEDPRIDRLIQIESTTSLGSLIAKLRSEGVDAILDLHGKLRGLALRLCHPFTPSTVIPKPTRVQQFLVRNALTPFRPKHTIVERYYQAAEKLMGEPLKRAPLSLTVPESSYAELAKESDLPLSELQESYLLMPGAQWPTKRWPVERYVSVARALRARGVNIVSAGSPNEEPLLKELEEKGGVRALPLIQMKLLPALVASVRGFIGHDSGPMHIARAVGTPTLAIFGPTPSSQFDFSGHQLVERPQPCSPCHFYGRTQCPKRHFKCMSDIQPDDIVAAFESLSKERSLPVLF